MASRCRTMGCRRKLEKLHFSLPPIQFHPPPGRSKVLRLVRSWISGNRQHVGNDQRRREVSAAAALQCKDASVSDLRSVSGLAPSQRLTGISNSLASLGRSAVRGRCTVRSGSSDCASTNATLSSLVPKATVHSSIQACARAGRLERSCQAGAALRDGSQGRVRLGCTKCAASSI